MIIDINFISVKKVGRVTAVEALPVNPICIFFGGLYELICYAGNCCSAVVEAESVAAATVETHKAVSRW